MGNLPEILQRKEKRKHKYNKMYSVKNIFSFSKINGWISSFLVIQDEEFISVWKQSATASFYFLILKWDPTREQKSYKEVTDVINKV